MDSCTFVSHIFWHFKQTHPCQNGNGEVRLESMIAIAFLIIFVPKNLIRTADFSYSYTGHFEGSQSTPQTGSNSTTEYLCHTSAKPNQPKQYDSNSQTRPFMDWFLREYRYICFWPLFTNNSTLFFGFANWVTVDRTLHKHFILRWDLEVTFLWPKWQLISQPVVSTQYDRRSVHVSNCSGSRFTTREQIPKWMSIYGIQQCVCRSRTRTTEVNTAQKSWTMFR